jgi:hypothetical protein
MNIKNPTDNDKLAMAVFKDLNPFTITVTNGADAMYLSLALLNQMTGDVEQTHSAMRLIVQHAKLTGVETAINHFFNQANECDIAYPEFIKPILTLMINHMFDNKEAIHELV